MKTSQQLAERLKEVVLEGRWIANTNFKDQLEAISCQQAHQKIASLNTIAVLAQHVHYYVAGINNVFVNDKLTIKDRYSFDFKVMTTEQEWMTFKGQFWNDTEALAKNIAQLSNKELLNPFVDEKYGNYHRNIDGLIEHAYYHLGQIVLIKKMINLS